MDGRPLPQWRVGDAAKENGGNSANTIFQKSVSIAIAYADGAGCLAIFPPGT